MFYLASALLMPFRSLAATLAGREARWSLTIRQALIALATVAAVWATLGAIGWLVAAVSPALVARGASRIAEGMPVQSALRTAAMLGSVGTLILVLATVQVLRLLLPPRPTPKGISTSPTDVTESAA
jgi:hypothetical protein